MNTARQAFTMIEMIVVLILVGVIATIFLPRSFRRSPAVEWPTILNNLNDMVLFARQEAIARQKVYRLTFHRVSTGVDTVSVEEEGDDPDKPGRKIYNPVLSDYVSTTYQFDQAIKIKAVYLGKHEQLDDQRGFAFCYLIPEGLVQAITLQLTRRTDQAEIGGTYKMNPFFGRFEFYDGYVKPE